MRIAVIGTGISGMVTAYLLQKDHELVVYEANDYVGGHTHTVDMVLDGKQYAVDTGFIVFNKETYPNFVKLLRHIGVQWQPSRMSFSVKCERTGLEYSPSSLNALFAQRGNLFRFAFYRMVWDIFRFRLQSNDLLRKRDYSLSLESYLAEKGFSKAFVDYFIIPMGAAIWSAQPKQFGLFPARYFVEFFKNHGFLKVYAQPQWLVIKGGSKQYVEKLTAPFADSIHLGCPVEFIRRYDDHVDVKPRGRDVERFDQVVLATHSDQALAILSDATEQEREILSAIPYQENVALLHTDESLLPVHKKCWASWNYYRPKADLDRVAVTYDLNILQTLRAPKEICVTLNMEHAVDQEKVSQRMVYHHPVYTAQGLKMRARRQEINGVNRTFFCGAYWGYGFHEDGVKSALWVCEHFGRSL